MITTMKGFGESVMTEKIDSIILGLKCFGAFVTLLLVQFLGGWDKLLTTLITLTVLDFITGVISGVCLKQLSSNLSYKGIIKKVGIYFIVALAVCLDNLVGTDNKFRSVAIGFYIVTEGISLLENWGKMGLPLPLIIKNTLLQLKATYDKEK